MADVATLQTQLAEAEAALHAKLTGSQVSKSGTDGNTIEFSQISLTELRGYIADLKRQLRALGVDTGTPGGGASRRVVF